VRQLWAPWRGELIEAANKPTGCIFCAFIAEHGEEADRRNLILLRTPLSFAILNRYPYNNGHLMVVPQRHGGDLGALTPAETADLNQLLQRSVKALEAAYHPQGFNIGMNLGTVAGAGIADHLHYHLVPRWGGDTNFMPVLADTKVMIEHLETSYDKLKASYAAP
jgi:ATP adenylyltransferase